MDHVGGSTARFVAVEVQSECPSKCSAEMSLGWSGMVSDGAAVDAIGDRRVGGLFRIRAFRINASSHRVSVNSQLPRHPSNGPTLELGLLHRLPSLPLPEGRLPRRWGCRQRGHGSIANCSAVVIFRTGLGVQQFESARRSC